MAASSVPAVDLLGFRFHRLSERECVEHVIGEIGRGRGGWIVTPNLDILRMLAGSADLRRLFAGADLVVADGMPIVWASRILGDPLPERVAGSSLIATLSEGAAGAGRSIYLLGGEAGTAEAAAAELRRRNPALRVAGTDCPRYGFETDAATVDGIAAARPDVVFVALGCPKQERLIERIRLAAPCAWWVGVGISFSYLGGAVKRAPAWMRWAGLEWVFRLAQEPQRLARRYLRNDLPFGLRLGALAIRARVGARSRFPLRPPRIAREARGP